MKTLRNLWAYNLIHSAFQQVEKSVRISFIYVMLWSITTRGLGFSSSELLGTFSNQTPGPHLSLQGKQAQLLKDKSGVAFTFFSSSFKESPLSTFLCLFSGPRRESSHLWHLITGCCYIELQPTLEWIIMWTPVGNQWWSTKPPTLECESLLNSPS